MRTMPASPEHPEFFDISPLVTEKTAVFPGDRSYQRKVSLDFKQGHNIVLSSIETSLHIGAHVDAANHYHSEGKGIDQRSLRPYLGKCQVIRTQAKPGERLTTAHLLGREINAERVLFRTDSFPDPDLWNGDFNSLSEELILYLASKGVILVGIDTPSIDPSDDKHLESHGAIYQHDIAVLEGIVLSEVPDGNYWLVALPLRLKDADASPVRAILLKGNPWN